MRVVCTITRAQTRAMCKENTNTMIIVTCKEKTNMTTMITGKVKTGTMTTTRDMVKRTLAL